MLASEPGSSDDAFESAEAARSTLDEETRAQRALTRRLSDVQAEIAALSPTAATSPVAVEALEVNPSPPGRTPSRRISVVLPTGGADEPRMVRELSSAHCITPQRAQPAAILELLQRAFGFDAASANAPARGTVTWGMDIWNFHAGRNRHTSSRGARAKHSQHHRIIRINTKNAARK